MAGDPGSVAASTIAIGQTVASYQFFLPRLNEVRQASPHDPTMRGDVLLGQVAAGVVSASVGVLLAWMTGSPVPVYVTLFIAVVIAAFYQFAMNGNRVMEP